MLIYLIFLNSGLNSIASIHFTIPYKLMFGFTNQEMLNLYELLEIIIHHQLFHDNSEELKSVI